MIASNSLHLPAPNIVKNRRLTNFSKYKRRLYKTALITAPLMGALSMVPLLLFLDSFPVEGDLLQLFKTSSFIRGASMVTLNVSILWFINIALVRYLPPEKRDKQVLRYILSFLIGFSLMLVTGILVRYLSGITPPPSLSGTSIRFYPLFGSFTINVFILVLISQIINQEERTSLKLEVAQLEISNLIAQQEQLKQNIHPHFLFNALSTLIVLIETDQKAALKYASTLSAFLRSSLVLAKHNKNRIQDELRFLNEYLDLQKVRFRDAIQFKADIPESVKEKGSLPVFALQVLAENAIKHNALGSKSPLEFEIIYHQEGYLKVSNNILPKYSPNPSTGIGLKNLGDRYEILGGSRPEINETDRKFSVTLKLL